MDFISFKSQLEEQIIVSLNDIYKEDPNFHRARLNDWQKKGYIKKIIRGYYIFSDVEVDSNILFLTANQIYSPSYVSLESALSYYNLIPEGVYTITSVSTRKTNYFDTEFARFSFKSIKKSLFFGYDLIRYKNTIIKMAQLEKVILDYLYLNADLENENDFASLRINKNELQENLNINTLKKYLHAFDNNLLNERVKAFLNYISC